MRSGSRLRLHGNPEEGQASAVDIGRGFVRVPVIAAVGPLRVQGRTEAAIFPEFAGRAREVQIPRARDSECWHEIASDHNTEKCR